MKKILSKVFKAPVVFSFGVIAAFALFTFFQPQKPAVGVAEANSSQVAETQVEVSQAEVATVPGQESVFLDSTPSSADVEWSTWFMVTPSKESQTARQNKTFNIDLNGDGLLDYVDIYREYDYQPASNDRIYLNNGHGWDLVYEAAQATHEGCFTDYESWPKSVAYNPGGEWNLNNMLIQKDDQFIDKEIETFADINGDGLPDYVWKDDYFISSPRECVYLNNGHGWDLAYRCVVKRIFNAPTYHYGDCAQPPYIN